MMTSLVFLANDSTAPWLWQALGSKLSLTCMALLLLLIPALLLSLRALVRIGRAKRQATGAKPTSVLVSEEGTVMMEFVLVFPFTMFFILMIAQTLFLMTGNLVVHYAAFCATRAAVVQVGADYADDGAEPQNTIVFSENSPKYEAVRRAAALACVPVSGPVQPANNFGEDYAEALTRKYQAWGREVPNWMSTVVPFRATYADINTTVTFYEPRINSENDLDMVALSGSHVYGPKDPITVQVAHRFYLSVPWAGVFFQNGRLSATEGEGYYNLIEAHYTLTNEGIVTSMPPRPDIDRRP